MTGTAEVEQSWAAAIGLARESAGSADASPQSKNTTQICSITQFSGLTSCSYTHYAKVHQNIGPVISR